MGSTTLNFKKRAAHHGNNTWSESIHVAKLPWKSIHPDLPTNYNVSERRLFSDLESLRRKANAWSQCNDLIKSQLTSGFIEQVISPECHKGTLH